MARAWQQPEWADGMVFTICHGCGRIAPNWFYCQTPAQLKENKGRVGCQHCGSLYVRPARIPEWKAALWVIGCYVWRKLILGRENWDPRMPLSSR